MLLFQIIAAADGFLISVLWFDLMFDVQVLRYRREPQVSEGVLDSIAAYYDRVTTTASPMGRLVALVMAVLLISLVVQAARGCVPIWVSVVSIAAGLAGMGLAIVRVFRRARRLGQQEDSLEVQSAIARSIFQDHIVCITAMATLLVVQLAAG